MQPVTLLISGFGQTSLGSDAEAVSRSIGYLTSVTQASTRRAYWNRHWGSTSPTAIAATERQLGESFSRLTGYGGGLERKQ